MPLAAANVRIVEELDDEFIAAIRILAKETKVFEVIEAELKEIATVLDRLNRVNNQRDSEDKAILLKQMIGKELRKGKKFLMRKRKVATRFELNLAHVLDSIQKHIGEITFPPEITIAETKKLQDFHLKLRRHAHVLDAYLSKKGILYAKINSAKSEEDYRQVALELNALYDQHIQPFQILIREMNRHFLQMKNPLLRYKQLKMKVDHNVVTVQKTLLDLAQAIHDQHPHLAKDITSLAATVKRPNLDEFREEAEKGRFIAEVEKNTFSFLEKVPLVLRRTDNKEYIDEIVRSVHVLINLLTQLAVIITTEGLEVRNVPRRQNTLLYVQHIVDDLTERKKVSKFWAERINVALNKLIVPAGERATA